MLEMDTVVYPDVLHDFHIRDLGFNFFQLSGKGKRDWDQRKFGDSEWLSTAKELPI